MPNKKNQGLLVQLKTDVAESKSIVVANYSGLNVSAQTELREKITEAGGTFLVTKNNIFKIAAQEKVKENFQVIEDALNGQNAFLFSKEDAVSPIKALFEFAKDNEALEIKAGILNDKVLTYEETENLSKLPSKLELIVKLMGTIQEPSRGLVTVLQGPTRGLVNALNAIKDQKSE